MGRKGPPDGVRRRASLPVFQTFSRLLPMQAVGGGYGEGANGPMANRGTPEPAQSELLRERQRTWRRFFVAVASFAALTVVTLALLALIFL